MCWPTPTDCDTRSASAAQVLWSIRSTARCDGTKLILSCVGLICVQPELVALATGLGQVDGRVHSQTPIDPGMGYSAITGRSQAPLELSVPLSMMLGQQEVAGQTPSAGVFSPTVEPQGQAHKILLAPVAETRVDLTYPSPQSPLGYTARWGEQFGHGYHMSEVRQAHFLLPPQHNSGREAI